MFNFAYYIGDMIISFIKSVFIYLTVAVCALALMIFLIVTFTDEKCSECEEKVVTEQCDEQINEIP